MARVLDAVLLVVCASRTYGFSTANATSSSPGAIAVPTTTTVLDNMTSTMWHEGYRAGYAAALAAMRMGRNTSNASVLGWEPPEPYIPS